MRGASRPWSLPSPRPAPAWTAREPLWARTPVLAWPPQERIRLTPHLHVPVHPGPCLLCCHDTAGTRGHRPVPWPPSVQHSCSRLTRSALPCPLGASADRAALPATEGGARALIKSEQRAGVAGAEDPPDDRPSTSRQLPAQDETRCVFSGGAHGSETRGTGQGAKQRPARSWGTQPLPQPHPRGNCRVSAPERSSPCTHIWGPPQTGGLLPLTLQQDLPIQAVQLLTARVPEGGQRGHGGGDDKRNNEEPST